MAKEFLRGTHQVAAEAFHLMMIRMPALRPSMELLVSDLERAAALMRRLISDPGELDRFADDDESRDEEKSLILDWLKRAVEILEHIPTAVQWTEGLATIRFVGPIPKGVERHLWFAMLRLKQFSACPFGELPSCVGC